MELHAFLEQLASNAPTPGGGSAGALAGGIATALASMVGNLTTGKKTYAAYQNDIDRILTKTAQLLPQFEQLMEADQEVFEPLSKAYGIPKDDPNRAEILEEALQTACSVPIRLLQTIVQLTPLLEELAVKGSKLAVSDVGCAAALAAATMQSAAMNIWVNTQLMTDRQKAEAWNAETDAILKANLPVCQQVFDQVAAKLTAPKA